MTRKIKLLVVDDEHDVKMLFEQKFRRELKAGLVEMLYAFSGEEALEVLSQGSHADIILILSDINMPGMTGLELLRVIKERMPHRRVMMITAYGDSDTREKAMKYGAEDFLTKPLEFDQLKAKIAEVAAKADGEAPE